MAQQLEDKLLNSIGFGTRDELRAFLEKLNHFVDTLTPAEKKVFHGNMRNCEGALKSLHMKVTRAQLRDFLGTSAQNCDEYTCCLHGTRSSRD